MDDSCFDRQIKTNIQEMQEAIRLVNEHAHRAQANHMRDNIDQSLERSQDLTRRTEQLFRDWTVHMAGEPTARHKSKFLYEKLQKAFREEVQHLKDARRLAMTARQEALKVESKHNAASATEFHSICDEDQSCAMNDEEVGLLLTSEMHDVSAFDESLNQNFIARDREESIKRIQSQVTDVNQMFRDLASIVSDQDQHLVTIERQAESTSSNTKQAVKELKKASDRQRSHFDKLCCLLASILLVFCFLVIGSFEHYPHLRGAHL
jgi:t-SNARE complex subunit (syntaxin)